MARPHKQLVRASILTSLVWLVTAISGCWQPRRPAELELTRGLIWMFPGVQGGPWMLAEAHRAFRDAGIDAAVEVYDWQRLPLVGSLSNLTSIDRNRREAALLADSIARHFDDNPGCRIDLIGYSGGGGLALMVAEALPQRVRLHNVILVQSATSPDYDLTNVLEKLDGKLINFYSPRDWLHLGFGTKIFGTMDRVRTVSAGKEGFNVRTAIPDATMRDRLVQHRWTEEMKTYGHYGGHLPMFGYEWNKKYVARYLVPSN